MSSATYLEFPEPITSEQWAKFCREKAIQYSPATVGGNTFYYNGFGGIEIHFGEADFKDQPPLLSDNKPAQMAFDTLTMPNPYPAGMRIAKYDWEARKPPETASKIVCSCFYGQSLSTIAEVAAMILDQFGGTWSADPEVQLYLVATHQHMRTPTPK